MNPRIKCTCGYDRFRVAGRNLVECQRCHRQAKITPDTERTWVKPYGMRIFSGFDYGVGQEPKVNTVD